jgi:hypothetical protein
MKDFAKWLAIGLMGGGLAIPSAAQAVFPSVHAAHDLPLSTDPNSDFWQKAKLVVADKDASGNRVSGAPLELRSRWTSKNLYFLFVCPYEELYLKPSPDTNKETYELWNWDVAEVFIGSDFDDIKRYKEFEVSPQGEWVDLDVNLHNPHHEQGWVWNSHFQFETRIDRANHVWYAVMKIPVTDVDSRAPAVGSRLRVNFFQNQASPTHGRVVAWQPTMSNTFHVPERFGLLELVP